MSVQKLNNTSQACEAHIALVIDESASIDSADAGQIRTGLRNFIDSQLGLDNRISLIAMSHTENDSRQGDHILNTQVTNSSVSTTFYPWINSFRASNNSVNSDSDHWSSGLQVANALEEVPDIIVIIADGLSVHSNGRSILRQRIANLNAKSHIFVYGIHPKGSYDNGTQEVDNLPQSLEYYLSRTPLASANNSDLLSTDYRAVNNFRDLQTALSALSQTLINSNVSCGPLEITKENIDLGTISLGCINANLAAGTITIKSSKHVAYQIEAGTVIATINGLTFSVTNTTILLPNEQQTIVPINVNGDPANAGNYTQVIIIQDVENPNNRSIEFCVIDRSSIENLEVASVVNAQYQEYIQKLCLFRQTASISIKQNLYNDLKALASKIIQLLRAKKFCDNTASLQEVCWLTLEDYEYNATIPSQDAVEEEQLAMADAIQKVVQPIWRPNTKYYLRFRLKDEVDNGENKGMFDYYYGFKTVGPVGHYHKHSSVDYLPANANPDKYPLTSLRQYIDYNRSYPNANGNLLQAKPLFYGHKQCKIIIYFSKPLAYHMVNKWHAYNGLPELAGSMHIAIKDPVTEAIIPYPLPVDYSEETVPLPDGSNTWVNDNDPRRPMHLQLLNNMIDSVNTNNNAIKCDLVIGDSIVPNSYAYSVTLTNLKPRKLYTALLYNAFDKNSNGGLQDTESEEVHQYVFQTSRYQNFEEQVKSYWLRELDSDGAILNERQAVFEIPLSLSTAEINTAYNIVASVSDANSDALELQYYHLFDRATEGVLGFNPVDPPESTEFNVLKDNNTGKVIGILIRNPEPFNIPKIPLEAIEDTIAVVFSSSGNVNNAYKVLYSKDYSQALIMHSSKEIIDDALNFRFQYKIWNGSNYEVSDTVVIENIQLTQ